jgi:hypothetical protein
MFNDRFILTYSNKTLATADFQTLENQVVISNKNKEIKNQYLCRDHRQSFIYDFFVRFIKKTDIATNELVISNLIQSNQAILKWSYRMQEQFPKSLSISVSEFCYLFLRR